jgi:hypothetical protein
VPRGGEGDGDGGGGGDEEEDARLRGDGSSISSVDPSAPEAAGGVSPEGARETDGEEEPEEGKKEEKEPVQPSEAKDDGAFR